MAILPAGASTPLGQRFVATYSGGEDDMDELERVRAFVRVREAVKEGRSPTKESELPWHRIQAWANGGAEPKSVKGLRVAAANGWLQPTGETRAGLVGILSWTLSNGLLREYDRQWEIRLYTDIPNAEQRLEELFDRIGTGWVTKNVEGETPIAKPDQDAAVLARLLLAMGATATGKGESTTEHLPWFLDTVNPGDRQVFARVWVSNLGVDLPISDGVSLIERRPESFRDELVELLSQAAGEGTVTAEDQLIHLDEKAAETLFRAPFGKAHPER